MAIFAATVVALGCLNAVLLVVLVARRIHLARRRHRSESIARAMRPKVLAYLDGFETLPEGPTVHEQRVLVEVLRSYGGLVTGSSRDRITAYFELHGLVEQDTRLLAARRASWRRAAAAQRLGDAGSPRAAGPLIVALEDRSRDVRTAAARSLGILRQSAAVTPLLISIGEGRIPPGVGGWALLNIGPPAVTPLCQALSRSGAAQRAQALKLLGLLGNASDAEAIVGQLGDESAIVRAEAALALGRLGAANALPALLEALSDPDPGVRTSAATALGRFHDSQALGPLLAHAREDKLEVARAAALSATAIDPELVARSSDRAPHLQEALDLERLR